MKIGYIGNYNDLKILNKRDIKCNIIVKSNDEFNEIIKNLKSGDTVVIPRASSVCNDINDFLKLCEAIVSKDCGILIAIVNRVYDKNEDIHAKLIINTAAAFDFMYHEIFGI